MYGGPFDFNCDGRTDGGELALGFALMSKFGRESELLNMHDILSELDEEEPDDCFSEEHDE